MAPKFPMEVDVFAVPHSRMKDLVGKYMDQVSQMTRLISMRYFDNSSCQCFES